MQDTLFNSNSLDMSISYIRGVWLDITVIKFCRISELNANSEDPDQTPHSAASDLGVQFVNVPFMGH